MLGLSVVDLVSHTGLMNVCGVLIKEIGVQ